MAEKLKLRFFEVDLDLVSDESAKIELFAHMFRHFQAETGNSVCTAPVKCELLTAPDAVQSESNIILDGVKRPLPEPELLDSCVYAAVLESVFRKVRGHFLIHAGAVSWNDQGLILAADSGYGKTTLVLDLVRRGWKFLSDETAALRRIDCNVHPFPRSLRIRSGTVGLLGISNPAPSTPVWMDKLVVDIEEIQPGSVGKSAPIRRVVILKDPNDAEHEESTGHDDDLRVLVDRTNDVFLEAISGLDEVNGVSTAFSYGYPLLKLNTAHKTQVLLAIERLCRKHGIWILDVSKRSRKTPSFTGPVRMEPISTSQAAVELLRRFQGGHESALIQDDFRGSFARLFFSIMTTISKAKCYQMFVGPLPDMVDSLENVLESS